MNETTNEQEVLLLRRKLDLLLRTGKLLIIFGFILLNKSGSLL